MTLQLKRQEYWSRGQLLLRTFLGSIYFLPHSICLFFLGIAASFIGILNALCILFTGRIPESFFYFIRNFQDWGLRVAVRQQNLCDDYPGLGLGLEIEDEMLDYRIEYQENYSRSSTLLRLLFGFIMIIPHIISLYFIAIIAGFIYILNFFVILFTGNLPESFSNYLLGFLRWGVRVANYFSFYVSDQYPPFSFKEDVLPQPYLEPPRN